MVRHIPPDRAGGCAPPPGSKHIEVPSSKGWRWSEGHDGFAFRRALTGESGAAPERGVAHRLFEHAEGLEVLGGAPGNEAGAVAAAAEGERQGPERRSGYPTPRSLRM